MMVNVNKVLCQLAGLMSLIGCLISPTLGGRALPITSENYVIDLFRSINPNIQWDFTNYLVDLSGIYSKCSTVGTKGPVQAKDHHPANRKHVVDGTHPETKGSIGGLHDYTRGEMKHVKAVNDYLREGFKSWITDSPFREQVEIATSFGCSVRPGCSGFVSFSCLFTPKYGDTRPPGPICPAHCPECEKNIFGETVCTRCEFGYEIALDGTCRESIPCPKNCRNCQNGRCIECDFGFTLTSQGTCVPDCPFPCDQCNSAGICIRCQPGYRLDRGSCVREPPSCPPPCEQCNSAGICTRCQLGYRLDFGTCVPEPQPEECPAGCKGPAWCVRGRCTKCLSSFYLNEEAGTCAPRSRAFTDEQYALAEQITNNDWDRGHTLENLSGYDISCDMVQHVESGKPQNDWRFTHAEDEAAARNERIKVVDYKGIFAIHRNTEQVTENIRSILEKDIFSLPTKKVGCSVIPDCDPKENGEMYVVVACLYEV